MKTMDATQQPETFTGHVAAVTALAFSPDGLTLVCGDADRHVVVKLPEGKTYNLDLSSDNYKVKTTERMRSIAFSPDGQQFYVSASDRMRAFWTETGEETWSYRPARFLGFLVISPLRLAVSHQGLLAACFDNATIGIWSPFGHKQAHWRDPEAPNWLGWLQDGVMVVGADSYRISLWDSRLRVKFARWVSEDRIYNLTVHPTEDVLAIRTLHEHKIMDAKTGAPIGSFKAAVGLPLASFRPGHQTLAVGEENGVAVVDYSGEVQQAVLLGSTKPTSLAWSADGKRLAVGCFDGCVRVLEIA